MPSDEPDRGRPVATRFIGNSDRPDGELGDWVYNLPRDHRLDGYRVVDETEPGIGWAIPETEPLEPVTPSSHRTGTCFDVESTEMREHCVDPLQQFLGADAVVHEVRHQRSGYHTDLVYADVDVDALLKRESMFVSNEPVHDPLQRFRVWWYLVEYGPKNRAEAIENGRYSDPSTNRKHLDWLVKNGYVSKTSTGHVDGVKPPKIADLHAVELKLRDWEKALKQADRANRCDVDGDVYSNMPPWFFDRWGYADYRWVALDAGAIGPALDNADEFRDRGVGLLGIAEGGTVVKHIDAKHEPRKRYTRDRAHVESQVWEALDVSDWLDREKPDEKQPENTAQPTLSVYNEEASP